MTKKILNIKTLFGLILGFLFSIFFLSLDKTQVDEWLEYKCYDFFYYIKPLSPQPENMLIVGIDEASFQEIGLKWPWPRSLHAELVNILKEKGAKVIAFDILFADPTNEEDDLIFEKSIKDAGNVVLLETIDDISDPNFSRKILVQPLDLFYNAANKIGIGKINNDIDGTVRQFNVIYKDDTFGERETITYWITKLYKPFFLISKHYHGFINYIGPSRTFKTVSYYQVINKDYPIPDHFVKDKVVLVGRMLEAAANPQDQPDFFLTPYYTITNQRMAGSEIHMNILNTILNNNVITEISSEFYYILKIIIFMYLTFLMLFMSPFRGIILLTLSYIFLYSISYYYFLQENLWIPPVLLSLFLTTSYTCCSVFHYFTSDREKRWLRGAFSRYVSKEFIDIISAHPEKLSLGGEERELSIFFSDVKGFTSISEKLEPQKLVYILNIYFTRVTQIILNHKGTVDKFIGDAVMAFWGAPIDIENHAEMACTSALEIQKAINKLDEEFAKQGLPSLYTRIGIHTGRAVVGNMGSNERFNYTVMGDTVNLASRLEGVNKRYSTKILISEETYSKVADKFWTREVDKIVVKGKELPVTIYELISNRQEQPPIWLEKYDNAVTLYRENRFNEALVIFTEILEANQEDGASRNFIELSKNAIETGQVNGQKATVLKEK